eukprot:TRINITY_DN1747_c3_g1_i3.p1 TRINITY_DN1747_c3_g1~~TRINITY_DN1747_c3_g1_i3.p1  ORF type:complete len:629 (-),score=125.66 TRINITY_DN1747_c3_g1_i3:123-1973(-)
MSWLLSSLGVSGHEGSAAGGSAPLALVDKGEGELHSFWIARDKAQLAAEEQQKKERLVARKDGKAMPKKPAKHQLPPWEIGFPDSIYAGEISHSGVAREERAPAPKNILMTKAQTEESNEALQKASAKKVRDFQVAKKAERSLKSYEQKKVFALHAAGDTGPDVEADTSSSDDDGDPYDQSSSRGTKIPLSKDWRASPGAEWHDGLDHGRLAGTQRSLLAYYQGPDSKYRDLDMSADIMLRSGQKAGLAFRVSPLGSMRVFYMHLSADSCEAVFRFATGEEAALEEGHVLKKTSIRLGWHTFRVRAVDTSLMFFLDNERIGQYVEDEGGSKDEDAAYIGLWAADSDARIRYIFVTDLEATMKTMHYATTEYDRELSEMQEKERLRRLIEIRKLRAIKLIQHNCKVKLARTRARMRFYEKSKELGCEDQMRKNQVLAWVTVFALFEQMENALHGKKGFDRDICDKKEIQFLRMLDETSPPPPPPPAKEPPSAEDEVLHYKYQLAQRRFKHQWNRAGRVVIGEERFRAMQNESKCSADAKRAFAERLFKEAFDAPSEAEHQAKLYNAWRLENDWADPEKKTDGAVHASDTDPEKKTDGKKSELAKWVDAKMKGQTVSI